MVENGELLAGILKHEWKRKGKKIRKFSFIQIMAPAFLLLILCGGLILMLPVCNADGRWLNFVDALFTSCTCVCVTGLVTVVPAYQFTLLGKLILLFLIQVGGWGVIVVATYLMTIFRRKIGIGTRVVLLERFNQENLGGLVRLLLFIVNRSILIEAMGVLGYSFCFIPQYGFLRGVWYSIFHAVSAFCNAGVDLLGESSMALYVTNPWMNAITIFLIVAGGLGFLVWQDLDRLWKKQKEKDKRFLRRVRNLSLHTKITLVMTLLLIFSGMLFVYILEFDNPMTLGAYSGWQRWMCALFQSVTTRTAGFYTISQAGFRNATKLLCSIYMFIGGSPVGTAGGIKTVTVFVLMITCWSIMKGREDTECFHRKIAPSIVRVSMTVFAAGITMVLVGSILLSALEPSIPLVDVVYEVASASATVGLTADVTPALGISSKLLIIVLMYLGRIGPTTLPLLLAGRLGGNKTNISLPEEHIMVG